MAYMRRKQAWEMRTKCIFPESPIRIDGVDEDSTFLIMVALYMLVPRKASNSDVV
ncbi:hypothetical protein CY34DRAFT_807303, partial [Suillus luteus UH-Slu-Lm8-n1]